MNEEQKEKLMSVIRSLNAIAEHLQLVMAVLNTARVDLAEAVVAAEKMGVELKSHEWLKAFVVDSEKGAHDG